MSDPEGSAALDQLVRDDPTLTLSWMTGGPPPGRLGGMVRGLALSGGGARGSFQMGAIDCLYTVFGYRPQAIAGTSVGSINAIALAQASNDDEALSQMRKLRTVWDSLTGPGDFYAVRDWFARLTRSQSLDLGAGVHIRIEDAIIQLLRRAPGPGLVGGSEVVAVEVESETERAVEGAGGLHRPSS